MNTFEVDLEVADRVLILELIEGDHISEVIRETGDFYERGMLDDIARRTRPGDLVVDVGAYIGNHTVFLAGIADLRVVAIEPYPSSANILRSNVKRNNLGHLVEVHEIAAGTRGGFGGFVVPDPHNLGMVRVGVGEGPVEIEAVDAIIGHTPVVAMKIDVEGMELDVLNGSSSTIRSHRPLVYAEVADIIAERQVRHWMDEHGYSFTREFNETATQLFAPSDSSVPTLYPEYLSMQSADHAYALAQLTRVLQDLVETNRKQVGEIREYREQLRRTTGLFAELYKRIRNASRASEEIRAHVEKTLIRLEERSFGISDHDAGEEE